MSIDFSSAGAWRHLMRMAKVGVVLLLVAAALAIPMNAMEGRALVPASFLIVGPLIYAIFMMPWVLWWGLLRLSEMTLGEGD
jgi:hypothetical protein